MSVRRRHAAAALAIVIGASPVVAVAEPSSPLAALVARWRTLEATDPQVTAVVRALAARVAPEERETAPPARSAPPAPPATAAARAWPAAGAARLDGGAAAEGLRLRVPAAAAVRVPAAGRVVFADRIAGLGLVLITAHGDEYHSVLAGLGTVDVGAGTPVAAGEKIGRMAEGSDSDLELHLELRHHGRPVDPLPWLGVNSAGDGRS